MGGLTFSIFSYGIIFGRFNLKTSCRFNYQEFSKSKALKNQKYRTYILVIRER